MSLQDRYAKNYDPFGQLYVYCNECKEVIFYAPPMVFGVDEYLARAITKHEETCGVMPELPPVQRCSTPNCPMCLTRDDRERAVAEADAIMRMAWPVTYHTNRGCNCKDCDEKFYADYQLFVEEFEKEEDIKQYAVRKQKNRAPKRRAKQAGADTAEAPGASTGTDTGTG